MKWTRFYKIWEGMKHRCLCVNATSYKYYGARGIEVCKSWLEFTNFRDDMYEDYLKHVKEYGEKETSIDRMDNDGNYEKKNCQWATWDEQAKNSRTGAFLPCKVTFNGKTQSIAKWAKEVGLSRQTIHARLRYRGWSTEKALTTKV